jgi:hypothetical protein
VNWTNAHSSTLDSYSYDEKSETLCVRFKSGAFYAYSHVEPSVAEGLRSHASRGKYFGRYVKDKYPFRKFADEADLLDYLAEQSPEMSIAPPEFIPTQWTNCRLPAISF